MIMSTPIGSETMEMVRPQFQTLENNFLKLAKFLDYCCI